VNEAEGAAPGTVPVALTYTRPDMPWPPGPPCSEQKEGRTPAAEKACVVVHVVPIGSNANGSSSKVTVWCCEPL